MDGMFILGSLLFIVAVAEVCMYISLVRMIQRLPEPRRTVEREKIPADWDRIMEETVIKRRKKK